MGGGGVLPYKGYIGVCGLRGCGFSAALFINWVSILAILVIHRWFLVFAYICGLFAVQMFPCMMEDRVHGT